MKIMKSILVLVMGALLLTGCSSSREIARNTKEIQSNYNTCQQGYYNASELVKVELTADGKVKSMSVGNQNLKPCQMAKAPESAIVATVKVIGQVANTALNVASSAVPYVAISKVAVDGIKSAGNNTYNNDSFNSHSEANQANQQTTTTNTETVSGIKAGNDVDQSQQNQENPTNTETTTNTDDNSVNDSNNGGDDNSNTTETTNPIVGDTTVVEQPQG